MQKRIVVCRMFKYVLDLLDGGGAEALKVPLESATGTLVDIYVFNAMYTGSINFIKSGLVTNL